MIRGVLALKEKLPCIAQKHYLLRETVLELYSALYPANYILSKYYVSFRGECKPCA